MTRLNPFSGWAIVLVISACLTSCTHPHQSQDESAIYFSIGSEDRDIADLIDQSKRGMVVTAHPLASEAGQNMLARGGNAVDAMVAASFAISVVRPQSTGIGGGGFLLLYDPKVKNTSAYDFRERAPLAASRDMYIDQEGNPIDFKYGEESIPRASLNGHLAAGTPGLVHGLLETHSQYGKLSREEVLAPAIRLAREGFPVYPSLARVLERRANIMNHFEATREIFYQNDRPLQVGEKLVQADLAWSLEQIAKSGHQAFYHGEIANRIVAEMERVGGLISHKDLKQYQTIKRQALTSDYRGYQIVTMPPPSSGGVHIAQMLNVLEGYDIRKLGYGSPEYLQLLIEAMRFAYSDRAHYLGDPDFVDIPIEQLMSKKYADKIRSRIIPGKALDSLKIGRTELPVLESPSTTHMTVVDASGMIASTTHTVNFLMGSGAVVPGTGIILNNEMNDFSIRPGFPNAYGLLGNEANEVAPGKTMLSSMTPTIVFKDGQALMALGSPGGSRIITAILQVLINSIDFEMDLPTAVQSARIHHQWLPDRVWVEESEHLSGTYEALRNMGYEIEPSARSIGDIQAVHLQDGVSTGVSDIRGDGKPVGY